MKYRLQSFIISFTTAFALVFVFSPATFAQTAYTGTAVDLDPSYWCDRSTGYAINAYGDITGSLTCYDVFYNQQITPFLSTSAGGILRLDTLGGNYSAGVAINASDEITGWSTTANDATVHAFLYTPSGGMTDLGSLGGDYSGGTGINANGDVIGYSTVANGNTHAFLYTGGAMQDLGALTALAINDSGEITGSNGDVILYNASRITDLGVKGGGSAINDLGQVSGAFYPDTSGFPVNWIPHAFLYSRGTITNLGANTAGGGINNFSQIVGENTIDYSIFLYAPATGMVPFLSLLTPGCDQWGCDPWDGRINSVSGINDAGQMTGEAWGPGFPGIVGAVLFSPVTSSFSAFQAKLQITGKGETHFHLRGSFSLDTDSDGIDPLTQNVLLQLGSLPIPVQKGLFKQASNGEYVFQGVLGVAALDFRIKRITTTSFEFRVEGRTATPFRVTNPARFILMIGSNKTMGTLPWK